MNEDLAAEIDADLARNPRDPGALTAKAWLLRQEGRLREAILHCDAAIAAAPNHVEAWLERGFILASGGSMSNALACYERAVSLDPLCAPGHAGIASIKARSGDSAEGRAHAQLALAHDPANAIAAAALATMQIESGEAEAAAALLTPLADALAEPSADRSLLRGLLGDARHRVGDSAGAFASYAGAKADFAAINAPRVEGRPSHREFTERILAETSALNTSGWDVSVAAPAHAAARHIFLLGYPRSGNTLVENILASLPGVVALEERPTLAEADMAFLAEPGGLARLAVLGETGLEPYVQAYWDKVAAAGVSAQGQCFVDMDPLKSTRLPLISRLFPEARILLMRRDPRDVVWSCFHTNFALTNAAMDFTTLERAAQHYDAMMRLIDCALERLPLHVHETRYEALVQDFDSETRALCDFAGLEWTEELRNFDRTARKRGVSTASAGQVRKGLYDGSKQWERYAEYLAPVIPILQPWIDKFGY